MSEVKRYTHTSVGMLCGNMIHDEFLTVEYVRASVYDHDIALACKGHRETKVKLEKVTKERNLWMAVAKAYQDDDEPRAVVAEAAMFEWIRKCDKIEGKGE